MVTFETSSVRVLPVRSRVLSVRTCAGGGPGRRRPMFEWLRRRRREPEARGLPMDLYPSICIYRKNLHRYLCNSLPVYSSLFLAKGGDRRSFVKARLFGEQRPRPHHKGADTQPAVRQGSNWRPTASGSVTLPTGLRHLPKLRGAQGA